MAIATTEEQSFEITYPRTYLGARMYFIDTNDPDAGKALTIRKVPVGDDPGLDVGFCEKCSATFHYTTRSSFSCSAIGEHGHLVMDCDDGSSVIRAPIYSQEFLWRVVKDLEGISAQEKRAIKVVLADEAAKLPQELQGAEQALLADEASYRKLLNYSWFSI